jgi:hypothetical protein
VDGSANGQAVDAKAFRDLVDRESPVGVSEGWGISTARRELGRDGISPLRLPALRQHCKPWF